MFDELWAFMVHTIVIIGALGFFSAIVLSFLPLLKQWSTPLQLVSTIILLFGVWFEAGIYKDRQWDAKVSELKEKLAKAEAAGAKETVKIVTKVVTQRQVIKEKGDIIREYIEREVSKADKSCPIPQSVIISHNAAARNDTTILGLGGSSAVETKEHNELARPKVKLAPK